MKKEKQSNEKKCNAILSYYEVGSFINLVVELPLKNGETIKMVVNPIMPNKKPSKSLRYKVKCCLDEDR